MNNGKLRGNGSTKKSAVQRSIPGPAPVELSAAERAAIREVVTDPRTEQQRVVDHVVDRLMRELGG